MQISELVCEIPHSENQLSLLLEAIIVSCSYPLNYCLHKDYKEGLFLWENLDQGIITQFHFFTFSVVSARISWYERTQPRYVLPLRQPLFIYERLMSPAMHLGFLFASHLAQAARARLPCTAFREAENRYVYCIQKQTRKKICLIHTREQFWRLVSVHMYFSLRKPYEISKVYTEECFLTQLHAQASQQFTVCSNLNLKLSNFCPFLVTSVWRIQDDFRVSYFP